MSEHYDTPTPTPPRRRRGQAGSRVSGSQPPSQQPPRPPRQPGQPQPPPQPPQMNIYRPGLRPDPPQVNRPVVNRFESPVDNGYSRENSGGYVPPAYRGTDGPEHREPPRWPFFLAGFVGLVLLAMIGLYALVPEKQDGILGQIRKPVANLIDSVMGVKKTETPRIIKFETVEPFALIGEKTVFTVTTDMAVDSIKLQDSNASELPAAVYNAVNAPDNTLWTVTVIFEEEFAGEVYVSVYKNGVNYFEGKSVRLSVAEPTQAPTSTPNPTMPPTQPPINLGTDGSASITTPEPIDTGTLGGLLGPLNGGVEEPAQTPDTSGAQQGLIAQQGQSGMTAPPFMDPIPLITQAPDNGTWVDPMQANNLTQPETTPEPAPELTLEPAPEPRITRAPDPLLPALQFATEVDGFTQDAYIGSRRQKNYTREKPLELFGPDDYTSYPGGVFTFRGSAFRQNAAFGTVDMQQQKMSVLWQTPLGSLRTSSGTVYGLGWTGQPAIIKWSKELREAMNITEEKKAVSPLKEVIAAAQDGKVYFVDLDDGVATRDPIDIGYPLKGSVAADPQGMPVIAFGQGISKLASKTGKIGYYIYNLLDQKELMFINGRRTDRQKQHYTNGAFDGTALFDRSSDTMILAGENGLLYTVKMNTQFEYQDPANMKLTVKPETVYQLSRYQKQKDSSLSMESSVAMYKNYAFVGDNQGIVRCVDTTTMKSVWAFDNGDNTDATPALDLVGGELALYTGNTVSNRLKKAKTATIRRLNALTGEEMWSYELPVTFDKDERHGVKASPVVGQNSLSDLVFFTVSGIDGGNARVVALDKRTGQERWTLNLAAKTVSSPVAVYNKEGKGWIIQGDENGRLTLIDGLTGEALSALELGGAIDASPAVYNDVLVIGTCSKDPMLYGIRLQ